MSAVVRTKFIPAPPTAVWDVLADFEAIATWAPNVDHSCLLSEQRRGVGAVRRVQLGRATVVETVTAWYSDDGMSYSITGLPSIVRSVTNTWRLDADGKGTMATLTSVIDAGPRPPQQAIAKAVGRKLGAASDAMLAGLAAHLDKQELAS